jgi:hypothetical protein
MDKIADKLFLIIIYHFSLVKAAAKASRICKVRKNCLIGFDQCAVVLSKRLNLLNSLYR